MNKNLLNEDLLNELLKAFLNSELIGIKYKYNLGYSGAPVLAVQYSKSNDYGLNGVFIVKIGSVDWAKAEEGIYKKLANDPALIPLLTRFHMYSMPVQGMAAVAYGPAFDSVNAPQPLVSLLDYRNSEEAETLKQIGELSNALVSWYCNSNTAQNSVVESPYALIFRMLTKRRASDLLDRLETALPLWELTPLQITVEGLKHQLPNPLAFAKEANWKDVQYNPNCLLSRIHGDLNTGNVICDPELQHPPKLIDFDSESEVGVPFFDLAYLEFDMMRHLLPVEQEENRRHWLSLLEFSMAKIEGGQQSPGRYANTTWKFIQPIRQGVRQLRTVFDEDAELVWWLATVAVGLNFARKGDQTRSKFERMAGLLYAAYGLERVFELIPVEDIVMGRACHVHWITGYNEVNPPPVRKKDDVEDVANSIKGSLQHSLTDFRVGGAIYQGVCDELDTTLQKLEDFLHEQMQKTPKDFYDTTLLIDNIVGRQEKLLDALHNFREACLPLNTKTLSKADYDKARNVISHELDKILDKCSDLFKKLQ